jgi:hypothetical protein
MCGVRMDDVAEHILREIAQTKDSLYTSLSSTPVHIG